jgi:TetR/AcrR family transcriptional regulator, lmrAB and yxaGH operons repressor
MVGEVRKRMVQSAVQSLATRGLQGTSLSEVLELSGAPRGSIYHHFPGGKDELAGAAVDLSATQAVGLLDRVAGASAVEVVEFFLGVWRTLLTRTDFGVGCALVGVTVTTDSAELLEHAAAAFRVWRGRLAELLDEGGLSTARAQELAVLVLAASEGAVVLSRAERSLEPFEVVAGQLLAQVREAAGG